MLRISYAALLLAFCCDVVVAREPLGNVVRPQKIAAKVKGCQISRPDKYLTINGDLIEIEYTFPVAPGTIPVDVDMETDGGALHPSKLGIRNLTATNRVGTGTYLFYFEAQQEGKGTALVLIDGEAYEYQFDVFVKHNK